MPEKVEITLRDGTLVRHKSKGYEGRIEGTTSIKACFTKGGASLETSGTKEAFQYRISVSGESMRHVAPFEDLEIVDGIVKIDCARCHEVFQTKPGLSGKPCGRCVCGGWICPRCMACQSDEDAKNKATLCKQQQKRFLKKLAHEKKSLS